MVELTDDEIDEALNRGADAALDEPRAITVRHDPAAGKIEIALRNGCSYAFPVSLVPSLSGATAQQLSDVQIAGTGTGITFPELDVDLSVQGLLLGLFGTRRWLAGRAGAVRSEAKAKAARENGRKGGRPRKP